MTKIIQRHDTAANWTSVNPVLALGEMGVETDTNKFKFGDGTTAWSELAYATSESSGGSGTQLTSADGSTEYGELALGDTLAVSDGVLNANLDELGNEVNTLSSRVTTNEDNITKLQENKQDKLTPIKPINIETITKQKAVGFDTLDLNAIITTTYTAARKSTTYWFTSSKYNTPHAGTFMQQLEKMGYIIQGIKPGQILKNPAAVGYYEDEDFIPVIYFSPPEYNSPIPYLITNFNKDTGTYSSAQSSNKVEGGNTSGVFPLVQIFENRIIFTYSNGNSRTDYFSVEELSKITHVLFTSYISGSSGTSWSETKYGYPYRKEDYYNIYPYSIANSLQNADNACTIGIFDGIEGYDISSYEGIPSEPINLISIDREVFKQVSLVVDNSTIKVNESGELYADIPTPEPSGTTIRKEIPFPLNLTSNGTLGGSTPSCTGSSYETDPEHPYYYAFKGATTSTPSSELWGPSSGTGNQYLILDCVTPIALQSFRWTNGGTDAERFPVIVFKGSNDNSTYTTLATYETQDATDDSVTINNTTPYRYYKFEFPEAANWGKLGFISITGGGGYDILNIGDGLEVTDNTLSVNTDTYSKNEVDTLLSEKQNKLTAGTNITIEDNVISGTLPDNVITSDNISQNEYVKQLETEITAIGPNLLEMMANAGIITNVVLSWGTQKPTTDGTNVTIYQGTKIVLPTGFDSNGRATNAIYTTTQDITVAPTSNVLLMSISGYTFNCGAFYNQPYQSVPENPLPNTWLYSKEDNKNYQYVASGPTYNQYTYTPIMEVVRVDGAISKLILNDCPVMQGHLYNIQNT